MEELAKKQELCHIKTKMLSIRKTFVGEDAQERELFKVTKKMARESPLIISTMRIYILKLSSRDQDGSNLYQCCDWPANHDLT